MFSRLSFRNAIKIIMLLAAVTILALSFMFISAKNEEVTLLKRDKLLIDLVYHLDFVAHNFAVERGLSAGFIGSGSSEIKQKVENQRAVADKALQSYLREN